VWIPIRTRIGAAVAHVSAPNIRWAATAAATAAEADENTAGHTVAHRGENNPVVVRDRLAQQLVMARQCSPHRGLIGLPQTSRALYVREEERHRP
jgi:hypothetical protein